MMLGKMRLARGMYRDGEPVLVPDGRDLEEALAEAVKQSSAKTFTRLKISEPAPRVSDVNIPAPDYIKPNAFCVHEDGRVCIREDDKLRPLDDMAVETRSRIRRLIEVRDAVRVCLRSQLDGSSEEQVVEARDRLNLAYDRFLSRFGPINAHVNQCAFDGDPDLPLLLSLEHYDDERSIATKASIFHERTIHDKKPIESVGTPERGVARLAQ
jgi:N12 class adenine-specific DNA methylase